MGKCLRRANILTATVTQLPPRVGTALRAQAPSLQHSVSIPCSPKGGPRPAPAPNPAPRGEAGTCGPGDVALGSMQPRGWRGMSGGEAW